jgi:hypothetical protein
MSAILYSIIHDTAKTYYEGPELDASNYDVWVAHWFDTAEKIAVEFDNQKLPATAEAIRAIILDQRKLVNYEQR